jgi:hypothetical protein
MLRARSFDGGVYDGIVATLAKMVRVVSRVAYGGLLSYKAL